MAGNLGLGEFGDLCLELEEAVQEAAQNESWAVCQDGSLRHSKTGILIGEQGLRDGKNEIASDPSRPRVDPADIEVDRERILGRGAGGVVSLGRHKPTGTLLAVKVVWVEDKAKRAQLINELHNLLRITKSPFLIHLYAAYVHKETGCVHVALEFMDYGSLADVKKKVHTMPEKLLALVMMQILEGLKTLHLSYVVHRDVKLGNILVNSRGIVKVTDFGISKKLDDSAVACDTFVGTATHMSPERVKGEDYSFSADIWSLGLCVYELASGIYPYGSIASFPMLYDSLCNKAEPRLPKANYSAELCGFVEKCLQKRPEHRWTAIQLQAHQYILSNILQMRESELVRWLEQKMKAN